MEDRLSKPLPLLPLLLLDHDQKNLERIASETGPFTTPGVGNDTAIIIHWQAAELLHQIDVGTLIRLIPKKPGSMYQVDRIPIIKSYMNMLLLCHEAPTDKQWIFWIPYHQNDEDFLTEQVEPLVRVNNKFSTFRANRLYRYGLANDPYNNLGIDYMLLDFIDGRQMPMWTEDFPTYKQKKQILEQIADVYVEMFSNPVTYGDRLILNNPNNLDGTSQADFGAFDLPPTNSASKYLHDLADRTIAGKIHRLTADDIEETTVALNTTLETRFTDLLTLLLMRALIPSYVVPRYNDSAFYVTHPDLHNRNIIIKGRPILQDLPSRASTGADHASIDSTSDLAEAQDVSAAKHGESSPDNLKIVGLIDWDSAHPVPLQTAAILPKFLETVPGAEFPDLPGNYVAPDLTTEKMLFLQILGAKEMAQTGARIVTHLIRDSSWERDFFTIAPAQGGCSSEVVRALEGEQIGDWY